VLFVWVAAFTTILQGWPSAGKKQFPPEAAPLAVMWQKRAETGRN
jgi:hypothetical protein